MSAGILKNSNVHNNSLNLFRLIASIQVLLGHLKYHLELTIPNFIQYPLNMFLGVPLFFVLSGFLIWDSIERTSNFKIYFTKRILRIYPELWVCLFFEILSIIIFYNRPVPLIDYSIFTFTQGTFMQFWTPDSLRAYGCGCPNGSLWTISVIVQFYIFIYVVRNWLNKREFKSWTLILLLLILISLCGPIIKSNLPTVINKLYTQTLIPYFWIFFLGVYVSKYKDILLDKIVKYWYVCGVVYLLVYFSGIDIRASYGVLKCIVLTLFMFGFAYRYPQVNIKKDISYGIYIYIIWYLLIL